jgi:hypothetical protein
VSFLNLIPVAAAKLKLWWMLLQYFQAGAAD